MSSSSSSSPSTPGPATVGFIGLGAMGIPMVYNIVSKGIPIVAYNRTVGRFEELQKFIQDTMSGTQSDNNNNNNNNQSAPATVQEAKSAVDTVRRTQTTLLMLSDYKACQAVIDTIVSEVKNKTIVNHSTIGRDQSLALAKTIHDAGGTYVEAPVLGSTPHATKAILQVLVGAEKKTTYEEHVTLFSTMGKPKYVGKIGDASVTKLALNQILIAQTTALATSLGLVEQCGLSTDDFMDTLRGGVLHSRYFDFKHPAMTARNFPSMFPTTLMLKDVKLALALAESTGVTSKTLQGASATLQDTIDAGFGDADFSSVYNVINPKKE
jgi:3-hydroxyisobutyrate dehydrogenase